MSIVPEYLTDFMRRYPALLDEWYSQQLYQRLLRQTPNPLFVWLHDQLDLRQIEAACAAYRHPVGPGCPPTYRIAVLVRLLLVKYLRHLSFREAEAQAQSDLWVRWFLGVRLLERVPDHTSLFRFERWVQQHLPDLYFREVLQQIDQAFPADRDGLQDGLQIADTFAMHGRVAMEGWVTLLRHTSRCLLRAWDSLPPPDASPLTAPEGLFGPADEPAAYYLSPQQRGERQTHTVRGVLQLLEQVQPRLAQLPPPAAQAVGQRLAELDKIVRDVFQVKRDAQGVVQDVQLLPEAQQGSYQICGANDPQATVRNHGGDRTLGYNAGLAIDRRGVIRAVHLATGATPDATVLIQLVAQQATPPEKLITDQAGSAGHTRAQVQQVSRGRTQVVARIAPSTTGARFGPEAFQLDPSATQLTCPAQRTTASVSRASDREGRIFAFSARTCQACPLWTACRDPDARPTGPRRVFLSDYRAQIRQAQRYNQSAAFASEMKLRPLVERVIRMLTAYEGLRQATRCGLANAAFQLQMGAMCRNLRTWHARSLPAAA